MKLEDVSVDVKLVDKPDSKLKAFADVVLPLGPEGVIGLTGFSVIQTDNRPPRVALPSRKSGERYYETVTLIGPVRGIVEETILAAYKRQRSSGKSS